MVSTGPARGWTLHASRRTCVVPRTPQQAWEVLAGAGPGPHWYVDAPPFVLRGALDRVALGGGRRWPVPDRDVLVAGDRAGFWEVREAGPLAQGHRLVLEAAVRAPGTVTLALDVVPAGGDAEVRLEIRFAPRGVLGAAYLLVDLPARETLTELVHRRIVADVTGA